MLFLDLSRGKGRGTCRRLGSEAEQSPTHTLRLPYHSFYFATVDYTDPQKHINTLASQGHSAQITGSSAGTGHPVPFTPTLIGTQRRPQRTGTDQTSRTTLTDCVTSEASSGPTSTDLVVILHRRAVPLSPSVNAALAGSCEVSRRACCSPPQP